MTLNVYNVPKDLYLKKCCSIINRSIY